jgi:hypothetical protein
MNAQNLIKARAFLNDWPRLATTTAILQLSALLALDWTQAEAIYKTIAGA